VTGKLLRIVAAVAVLVAAALIGWRVLAPAEVRTPATGAYPVAATVPPGVTGKLATAPLIVDGRIRVYAGTRLVKADGPVQSKSINTARWAFRRWPERLSGVVAVATTVVTRWSDGELVALDAGTGEVVWRAPGPPAEPFATGAAAVWAPQDFYTAGSNVLATGGRRLVAYAIEDGSRRWSLELPASCGNGFTTAGGQYVCGSGPVPSAATWPAGPFTAVGCDVARSGCAGLRDGSGQGWLTGGARPVRAPALDAADATASQDLILGTAGEAVLATRAGREVWRWAGTAQVLGVRGGRAVLLTENRRLVVLDAVSGVERANFMLYFDERVEPWTGDLWQLTDGYVAIDRLTAGDEPYSMNPVVVAAF
jgi:hypothetical protein